LFWRNLFKKKDVPPKANGEEEKPPAPADVSQQVEPKPPLAEVEPPQPETAPPQPELLQPPTQSPLEELPEPPVNAEPETRQSFFQRLKAGLAKTRQGFVERVEQLVSGRKVDEELFEELEELLIQADCGVPTAVELVGRLRERAKAEKITEGEDLKQLLQLEISDMLAQHAQPLKEPTDSPYVIMMVGVNGAGKTTTIGKLAYRFRQEGAKVMLAAGDTFRAAAIDQLKIWADRVGASFVSHQEGADPAAVAYDAVNAARARGADVMILDTAGRLQTKANLMAELGKVHRVVQRELGRDVDEILLVVDATTGQNALSQARLFGEAVPITGIVLTKLDGTAKGGIILALSNELKLPVKLIGVGEKYTDLRDFDPDEFAKALFD